MIDAASLLELLARREVRDEQEADARAVGWVTISTDLKFGSIFVVGMYTSRIDAEMAAADQQAQMDEFTDESDVGWYVKAYRVAPKEDS